jgi:nucleoside-diphosphate-sugar epimerase
MEGLVNPAALSAWLARPQSRVAVTGASGWIGMALVDRLLAAGARPGQLLLLGSGHRPVMVGGATLQVLPLAEPRLLKAGDWLVLHAAIAGPDRIPGADWSTVRGFNDGLLDQAMTLAARVKARSFVLFSSGAVHRTDFGSPNRQAYARMKAEHELAAEAGAGRWGFGLLTPRVFNLAGPFMTQARAYALGDFILSAAREGRIRIGSRGPVLRSFVHVSEMADVILHMALASDRPGAPFDVAGPEIVEIGGLARVVGEVMGLPDLVIERPEPLDGEPDRYVGDGSTYQAALAEADGASVPLSQMVADTVAWLRATQPDAFQA